MKVSEGRWRWVKASGVDEGKWRLIEINEGACREMKASGSRWR